MKDLRFASALVLALGLAQAAPAQRMLLTSQNPPGVDLVDLQAGVLVQEDFLPSATVGMQEPRDSALVGGQIWVSDVSGIYRFDGTSLALLGILNTGATGADQSRGILGDNAGAWVAQSSNLVRYDLAGTVVSSTQSPINTTLLDVVELAGSLLVSSSTNGQPEVLRYDLAGAFQGVFTPTSSFPSPLASSSHGQLSVRPSSGTVLLSDGGRIYEIDPQGGLLQTLNPSIFETATVELPDGRFLVADALGLIVVDESGSASLANDRVEQYEGSFGAFSTFDGGSPQYSRFCPANVNSTGLATQLSAIGSTQLANGELYLEGISGPPSELSLVVYGNPSAAFAFGDGFLCLSPFSPGIQRTTSLVAFDFQGQRKGSPLDYATDFAAGAPLTAGSSWAFQLVYRDTASGSGAFNASDAILLTFE